MTIPWLLKLSIDALRSHGAQGASIAANLTSNITTTVARNAGLIAIAAITQAVIRTASRIFIFNAGRNIEYGLRRDLFAHLCRLDPGFFRRHATGDVMSRLTNDLSAVRMLFGPASQPGQHGHGVRDRHLVAGCSQPAPDADRPSALSSPHPGGTLVEPRDLCASRALQEQLGALATTLQEDLGRDCRRQELCPRGSPPRRLCPTESRVPGAFPITGPHAGESDAAFRGHGRHRNFDRALGGRSRSHLRAHDLRRADRVQCLSDVPVVPHHRARLDSCRLGNGAWRPGCGCAICCRRSRPSPSRRDRPWPRRRSRPSQSS